MSLRKVLHEKLDGLGAKSKARIIGSADRKVSTNMYETNVRQDTDVRSLRQRARDLVLVHVPGWRPHHRLEVLWLVYV